MIYSLGYYLPIVIKECELGRIQTREDMDVTLQLLRKGYPNAVWHTTVNDQRKYDAPGGATNERTIERSNADAHQLAALHPGYVSVVRAGLQMRRCQDWKSDVSGQRHCRMACARVTLK